MVHSFDFYIHILRRTFVIKIYVMGDFWEPDLITRVAFSLATLNLDNLIFEPTRFRRETKYLTYLS